MILVEPDNDTASVATKMKKLQCVLPHATGEILCFVDVDVTLRPDALRVLIPYLYREQVGVVFGLPCFTNWQTIWSSLVSGLVNTHMLLNFVVLSYLIAPIRINGMYSPFNAQHLTVLEGRMAWNRISMMSTKLHGACDNMVSSPRKRR